MNNSIITAKAMKSLPFDRQFEEYIIEEVKDDGDYYTLNFEGGSGIGCAKTKFVPKPKMKAKLYGRGFGYSVRGIVVDGTPIYYRTPEEQESHFQEEQRQRQIEKEKEFEKNKDKLDADFNALPKVYQIRINWFRKNNSRFRIEYEPYELFVCKESLKIAKALEFPEAIEKWSKMDSKEQEKYVKIDQGHSGNTFGCAVLLAQLYCLKPQYVILGHGALIYLCGCKDYGCFHNKERIKLAQPEQSLYASPYARFLALDM